MESVGAGAEMNQRGRQGLVEHTSIFRGLHSGLLMSPAGVGDAACGGGCGDSSVDAGCELLPSGTPPGVVGGVLGSGSCACLVVDRDGVMIASTASGVKSGVPIERGGASVTAAGAVSQVTSGVAWSTVM